MKHKIEILRDIRQKTEKSTSEVDQLVAVLKAHSELRIGAVQINNDGIKYRFDHYTSNYRNTPTWLSKLFSLAAKSSGKEYSHSFGIGKYSFCFDRAKFKRQKDGGITFSEMILLGYS